MFTIPTAFTTSFNYDRLRFVGESVTRFILSTLLYHRFPNASDAALQIQLHKLLNTESMAQKGRSPSSPPSHSLTRVFLTWC
jgi:dsRNA-specific ribonuclease